MYSRMVTFPSPYASPRASARKTSGVLLAIGMSEKMSTNLLVTYNRREMSEEQDEIGWVKYGTTLRKEGSGNLGYS